MLSKKLYVGIAAIIIFVAGSGYIVYAGRPVMKIDQTPSASQVEQGATAPSPTATTETVTKGTYTMTDVQAHNTQSDCWSAIGGDVYDLTSWVSRHPGGASPIIGLCGKDGTAAYSGQHGGAKRPKAMLVLLKIGTLN